MAAATGAFRLPAFAGAPPRTPMRAVARSADATGETGDADPDLALVRRIGTGDETAFRLLIANKLGRIHGLATRLLNDRHAADDVAQETLLRVWRHAGAWQPGGARFDTWLHRVVLNLCTDRLRRRREIAAAAPPDAVDPAATADAVLERDDDARAVRDAVAALPDRQREAITLHVWAELSNIAIADAMGISVEAVESLLARGRRALRAALGGPT